MTKGSQSFRRCSIAIKLYQTPFLRYLLQACPQLCHHPIWQVPPWQLMGFEFGIPSRSSRSTLRHWLAQCCDETSTGHEKTRKISKRSHPHTHTWEEEDVKASWHGICEKDPWLVKLLVFYLVLSYRASTIHGFSRQLALKVACVVSNYSGWRDMKSISSKGSTKHGILTKGSKQFAKAMALLGNCIYHQPSAPSTSQVFQSIPNVSYHSYHKHPVVP